MFLHLSVCSQGEGVGFPACITGHMSRGKGVCIQGVVGLHPGGGGLHLGRGGSASQGGGQTNPSRTRKSGSTVRILLECILVFIILTLLDNKTNFYCRFTHMQKVSKEKICQDNEQMVQSV